MRASSSCSKRGHSSSWCTGLSLSRPLLWRSTSSRRAGSVAVAHGPSCSAACGIFPDQGLNPCPLHWQADFQPLRHQGSPCSFYLREKPFPESPPEDSPSGSTSQHWVTHSCLSCRGGWESHHLSVSISIVGCRLYQQE